MKYFNLKRLQSILCMLLISMTVVGSLNARISEGEPVEEKDGLHLNFFNIKMAFDRPVLYWSVNTPVKNDFFLVEKSTDGRNYVEIGKINGTKQSNYSFVDDNPDRIINYYRFKRVQKDSSYTVGPVKVVVLQDNSPYVITPCLVKKWITVCNVEESYKESVIQIIHANTGEILYQTTLLAMTRSMQVNLSILAPGDYVAKIQNGARVFYHSFTKH